MPLTPEPAETAGLRYADPVLAPGGEEIWWVREAHSTGTIRRHLVAVPLSGAAATDAAAIREIAGGSDFFCIDPIVCVGWRSGTPHSNRGGSVVAEGDPVFLEMGATLARYTCPIMRTRVAGKPSPTS